MSRSPGALAELSWPLFPARDSGLDFARPRSAPEAPVWTRARRHQLLVEWNDTRTPAHAPSFPRLFQLQARRTPGAVAVCDPSSGDELLTYLELDRRSNQLARYLGKLGVGPEVSVGLFLERGVDLVVAILGVLKAGGAYVPLDPAYPSERLRMMLDDAGIGILITGAGPISAPPEKKIVRLDVDREAVGRESDRQLRADVLPESAAYVIFTSGSAGRPKAVVVPHRSLAWYAVAAIGQYRLESADRVLQFASISFDISVAELFPTLACGATLVLRDDAMAQSVAEHYRRCSEWSITVLFPPTAFWHELAAAAAADPALVPPALRLVCCGGERALRERVADWQRAVRPQVDKKTYRRRVRLMNSYGPTETTVDASACELNGDEREPPIGRPTPGVRLYLLDRRGRIVPPGRVGELCVAGCGVGRGYLGGSAATAVAFIPDRRAPRPGERLYRTGDLARFLADGRLEILGRLDRQVKIRGFRIDPEEIEAALRRHPSVREAVVLARERTPGNRRLSAYVVPEVSAILGATVAPDEAQPDRQERQVAQWQSLYEYHYAEAPLKDEPWFGWTSSYTGRTLLAEEMRDWLDHTVTRILSAGAGQSPPRRVLEIGCGDGRLLLRIAPECQTYLGTDFSQTVLDALRSRLASRDPPLPHVRLAQRRADDFGGIEPEAFDTVVLNSVVQYFPSVEYLLDVLRGAIEATAPGGTIFVGDVRSLPLLEAFCASVELFRADGSLAINELRQRLDRRRLQEEELVIDPDFFVALRQQFPRIRDLRVQPKRGRYRNELTLFRYDVTLRLDGDGVGRAGSSGTRAARAPKVTEPVTLDWRQDGLTLETVLRTLADEQPPVLALRSVPDARIDRELGLLERLSHPGGIKTVSELRRSLRETSRNGIEPEDVLSLCRNVPYSAELVLGRHGSFGAIFTRSGETAAHGRYLAGRAAVRPWSSYANDPLRNRAIRQLAPRLRDDLRRRLPAYMVPSFLTMLEALPRSPTGKVDRAALPAPDEQLEETGPASRNPVEKALVEIWSEVLGLGRFSVHESFLELGGDSILAIQIAARARRRGLRLTPKLIFEHLSVARLARAVEGRDRSRRPQPRDRLLPELRSGRFPRVRRDQLDAILGADPGIEDLYPLSPMQEGMLFHTLLDPSAPVYFDQLSWTLRTSLDAEKFKESWHRVVDRHGVLRSRFVWRELERPLQLVQRHVELTWEDHDWRRLAGREQKARLHALLEADRERGFDISRAPLMRWTLVRLSDRSYRCIWSTHHLLLDGWSTPLLLDEVFASYRGLCSGGEVEPAKPPPYRDYIAWLERQDLAPAESFWRRTLAGFSEPTPLGDRAGRPSRQRPDPGRPRKSYGEAHLPASSDTPSRLRTFAWRHRLTPNTLLQGAWALLLGRMSGLDDVVFGMISSGRPPSLPGSDSMVGLLINTLPLRVRLDSRQPLLPWLRSLQELSLEIRQFEHSPLVSIQAWSEVPRGLPLFESILVFDGFRLSAALARELERSGACDFETFNQTNYPLHLRALTGRELELELKYEIGRFESATMHRLLRQMRVLLEGMITHPDRSLGALPHLTAAERHQLVVEWSSTAPTDHRGDLVHRMFEAQAERTPEAVALVFGEERLTYRGLQRRSQRLARVLRHRGIGPEDAVAVHLERSPAMVVAFLAVLEAGGAYLPLDPGHPEARLAQMIDDAEAGWLLTRSGHDPGAARDAGRRRILRLDRSWSLLRDDDGSRPGGGALPRHLAYIFYTSGSTGEPKGVAGTHRGAAAYLREISRAHHLGAGDVTLQIAPVAFDSSLRDLMAPLAAGAQVVLPETGTAGDPGAVLDSIERHRVSCLLSVVPSLLDRLTAGATDRPRRLGALRLVLCAGERLSLAAVREAKRWLGRRLRVVNLYGPTEGTCTASSFRAAGSEGDPGPAPIGRPDRGRRLLILDRDLHPAAIDHPGVLHLGGDLARGYLGRPGWTADAFIPDPLAARPGARLYRTGDLARFRSSGLIDFLGRVDHQLKLRGFRVEPGEIEAALKRHPEVREAAVVGHPSGADGAAGDARLVAYFVPRAAELAAGPEVADLRSFLLGELPAHMVPAAFERIERLPLTPNGKVDRRALPAPAGSRPNLETVQVAPRSPIEEILAGIWSRVLDLDGVGVHDDFFELGGHSLLGTRVISRIWRIFGVELPLRRLFERPTVAALAADLEAAARSSYGLRAASAREAPPRPVPGREQPLSFAQQRLWFLNQLEPDTAAYNMAAVWRLEGGLDALALAKAWREVGRRHTVLRTTFPSVEGRPRQVVAEATLGLPLLDLTAIPGRRRAEARRVAAAAAARPFDLARELPARALLLRLGKKRHFLVLGQHHIVSDAWSEGVLNRELAILYRAFSTGEPSPLPELPIQYADYAAWQRSELSGEPLETQLAYWRRRLEGLPALELPTDRPRPARRTYRGAEHPLELSPGLTASLRALSHDAGASLYMTLTAAFMALLYRLTGQRDVVVGSPVANRSREEVEELIGFFVNTLVLRGDLSGEPSFSRFLSRIREVALQAYAHQDLPFEKLVEELRPERSLVRQPLFQVLLTMHDVPDAALCLPGLDARHMELDVRPARFDLELHLWQADGILKGTMRYSAELFDGTTIARWSSHFGRLLEAVAADPECRVADLDLLTRAQRHQVLREWNDSRADVPRDLTLHRLFDIQAQKTPEAVAVVFEGAHLSYRELDRRARQVARYLRGLRAGPRTRVGISVERSLEMMVGLVGILKAGAAYVALDPSYPEQRLAFMAENSRVPILLTQERLRAQLPLADSAAAVRPKVDREITLLCLDADWPRIVRGGVDAASAPAVAGDAAAYVIYTSGSTGRPKGVVVSHRAIVNRLLWMQDAYGLTAADRVLQKTPLSFDVSVWELFWPLAVGARQVVASPGVHRDSASLALLIAEQGITTLHFVPPMLEVLLDLPARERMGSVRRVICSGEALPFELQQRFFASAAMPHAGMQRAGLHNLYGPTEAAVDVTYSALDPLCRDPIVTIGRPVANTRIHLLDTGLRPVPPGVAGELAIGGVQLARGYLRRARRTAASFVPDPLGDDPGARLYRTGDLARYQPDGDLELLGRIDTQIKVRGFRIEVGEIEAALRRHPAVREAVVLAREDLARDARRGGARLDASLVPAGVQRGGAGRYLVAYLIPKGDAEQLDLDALSVRLVPELRTRLAEQLPEYMVPARYVFLEALPLTPNGKVDRKRLPAPERTDLTAPYRAPASDGEEKLAAIWAEVLGLERVGVEDHFFELGGHSLVATQVISRVSKVFGRELPLRALFEAPTVARLAAVIASAARSAPSAIEPVSRDASLPLSFAQQRMWFLDRLTPDNPFYVIPAPLRLRGPLDIPALGAALNEIVRRHEVLRTSIAAEDGRACQRIAPASPRTLPVADLSGLAAASRAREARRLADRDAAFAFDLARDLPVRFTLLRLDSHEAVLLLAFHHIAADGWSLGVFSRELQELYRALRQGLAVRGVLEELPIQYADFAAWQRRQLREGRFAEQLDYWRRELAGVAVLELPTDRPRPAVSRFRGRSLDRQLDRETTRALKRLGREHGATPFMTLLALFQAMLGRLSGQRDIAVGSPIANRHHGETEDLLGLFVNTLVLRGDLTGDPTFEALLRQARRKALAAYAHQDLPFERLVEELRPERSLSDNPVFQVMLAVQNAPRPTIGLGDVTIRPMDIEVETVLFDLELHVYECPDGLTLDLLYDRDLFDASTAERLVRHLQTLVRAVIDDPSRLLSELPLLDRAELHQVMVEWNDTARRSGWGVQPQLVGQPSEDRRTFLDLFDAQVSRRPEAPAVIDVASGRTWTYRELAERSTRLAGELRRRGVGLESRVGVRMGRSVELVAAVLAVLRAGAAYVPLDPDYPDRRLRLMIEDSATELILVDDRDEPTGFEILAGGRGQPPSSPRRTDASSPRSSSNGISPENAAYVIYTSGSTGRPKGVVVSHRGLAWYCRTGCGLYGLGPGERVLQFASISFDLSVAEIFPTLAGGAALVLRDDEMAGSIDAFLRRCREHRVSVLLLPTAFWHELAAAVQQRGDILPATLRLVNFGGEPVIGERVTAWRGRIGNRIRLINGYGPTEATVEAVIQPLGPFDSPTSVGRPVSGVQIFVLDRDLRPVGVGVAGELAAASEGLARGYHRRAPSTARHFVPDPHARRPGERLYRTGDLCRQLADGTLELLGRIDQQVKIRGFRIEVGEIESVLRALEGISQAAVIAREDGVTGRRLVAYLVPAPRAVSEGALDLEAVRRALAERLPEYMVPTAFVVLEALPLAPSGKVDRAALRRAALPAPRHRSEIFRAPRTPEEEILCDLFAEILSVPRVGIDDNFFALGGHSLLAVRLFSRIRATLGVDIALRTLFEAPTAAELAGCLGLPTSPKSGFELMLPLRPRGGLPPLFCIHPISGLSWSFAGLMQGLTPERPIYGLQAAGLAESRAAEEPLPTSIEALAEIYLEAIREVQPSGPYHLLGWSFGGLLAHSIACRLQGDSQGNLPGDFVALLALLDSYPPQTCGASIPGEKEMEEPELLEDLARLIGLDGNGNGQQRNGPQTSPAAPQGALSDVSTLLATARREGHVLGSSGEEEIQRVLKVARHSHRLLPDFRPGRFRGDLLFFAATERPAGALLPEVWARHLSGRITVHRIRCQHHEMGRSMHIAEVGRLLEQYLTETRD